MKITSWGIIIIQALTPLLISASSVARANEYRNMEETILGMQSVVDGSAPTASQPSSPLLPPKKQQAPTLISTPEFQSYLNPEMALPTPSPETSTPNLPSLGSESISSSSANEPAPDLTGNAMQAGQILSSDNVTNASINYAKSIGEGLINQQINDWLNQKGTARFSAGSDQKISGDLLLPIIGNTDSLLFTQLGLHSNEDRNTANVGMGYRQYIGDWMYGINTFYDYDYTGKNARLGVGGEAWTDYLKLAVNGYYGLTDWHQSRLSAMKDYDERPANGFDLRAEAYLPSYPQLGANLKYEQYFGKGIDLGTGTHPDDLKDNPKALTFGLNYTPIPLVTLKGEHSVGDKDDSRIGIDVNYRFGVPWARQISADSVDALRSLMGSMYEFVDRNYEIVMQYRKQDLLRISLPNTVTAKAAETITLPLTVSKAKYGLKDVEWTASAEFLANGGTFRELSLTQLEVTLPPYVYTKRANAAQEYVIKAVGVDNNGNNSNTAATTIKVEPSKNIISDLTITPSGSVPANDADYFTVTASVLDEHSQPMTAQPIKFDIDNMKGEDGRSAATLFKDGDTNSQTLTVNTDSRGKATVYVRSKLAKQGVVTATMNNGNYKSGQVDFIADAATAQISALDIIKNKALADGQSSNKLQVTVKDINGNPLANSQVDLSATNGATIVNGSTVMTDAEGQAILLVTNTTIGDSTITARINGSSKTQVVTFVADKSTSTITQGDLTATQDAVANGTDTNLVTAKVTDANANTVSDVTVHFTVSNGAKIITVKGVTGDDGLATAKVTSLKADTYTVTARIQESGNSAQTNTRFIPDSSTATIIDSNLNINPNGALADGVDTDAVEAIVTDANGNLVPNASVNFIVATGATITTVIGTTGTDGKATATVTSTTAGKYKVTATVSGRSASKDAIFVADNGTAAIVAGNLKVTADNALANGTATNAVQAKVTDANGNVVPNVAVSFSANNGATVTTASAITNESGLATTTLSNTTSGVTNVVAAINGTSQNVNTNFTPDGSTATIVKGDLQVTQNDATANGSDTNAVQAKVTDANGNVVPNATVTFSANHGATVTTESVTTNPQGLASTTLTNTQSGTTQVTATVNSHSQQVDTNFVADGSTATITKANLVVTSDNAKADGHATNAVQAKVTDANGNLVPNAVVSFTADNGATIVNASVTTGSDGLASTTLTNIQTGIAKVTATINSHSQTVDTTFKADDGTATIISGNLTVTTDNAKANGTATNAVQAKVTDANGNVVPNVAVTFTADNGATVTTTSANTDENGLAATTLTNVTAGVSKVTAAINGHSQTVNTTFVADITTAIVTEVTLVDTVTDKIANGTDFFTFDALVKDAHGNLVPNATVTWSQDKGNSVVLPSSSETDVNGKATIALKSTKTEALLIQVSAAIGSGAAVNADKKVNFKAQLVTLHGATTNAVNNAVVPNTKIELFLSQSDTTPAYSATSGSDGKYAISNIPQGVYYAKASATGFITQNATVDIQDVTDLEQNFVLSPNLDGKAARIVLTWGSTPADLDSYLWVPTVGAPNTMIKVNYGSKAPTGADAVLDVDARNGYGPETITVNSLHPGVYCYVVNRFSASPQAYGDAKVKLYLSDGTTQDFKIEDAGSTGDMANWTVFKIDTTSGQTDVSVINSINSSSNRGECS